MNFRVSWDLTQNNSHYLGSTETMPSHPVTMTTQDVTMTTQDLTTCRAPDAREQNTPDPVYNVIEDTREGQSLGSLAKGTGDHLDNVAISKGHVIQDHVTMVTRDTTQHPLHNVTLVTSLPGDDMSDILEELQDLWTALIKSRARQNGDNNQQSDDISQLASSGNYDNNSGNHDNNSGYHDNNSGYHGNNSGYHDNMSTDSSSCHEE